MDPDLGRYPVVWAAAGLPTAVFPVPPGDAADPGQRDRRADRRGATAAAASPPRRRRPTGRRATGAEARTRRVTAEPRNATITYPGGLRARWRWGGSGQGPAVFALSEAGGTLIDLGPRVAADPDAAVPRRAAGRGPARRLDRPLRVD